MLGKYSFYKNIAETNFKHNCKIGIINCLGSFCWLHWQVKYDDIFNIHVRVILNFSMFPTFAILCLLIQNWQACNGTIFLKIAAVFLFVLQMSLQTFSVCQYYILVQNLRSVTLRYWKEIRLLVIGLCMKNSSFSLIIT